MMKQIKKIPVGIRMLSYGLFIYIIMMFTDMPMDVYLGFIIILLVAIYMYVSRIYENPTIEVTLFVDGEFIDKMKREIAPSKGDEIIIDCGEMVKVIEVSHQWDDPKGLQINCVPVKEE